MNRKTNKQGDYGLRINYKARLTFFFRGLFCFACFAWVVCFPRTKEGSAAPNPRGIRGILHAVDPLRGPGRGTPAPGSSMDRRKAQRSGELRRKVGTGRDAGAGGGSGSIPGVDSLQLTGFWDPLGRSSQRGRTTCSIQIPMAGADPSLSLPPTFFFFPFFLPFYPPAFPPWAGPGESCPADLRGGGAARPAGSGGGRHGTVWSGGSGRRRQRCWDSAESTGTPTPPLSSVRLRCGGPRVAGRGEMPRGRPRERRAEGSEIRHLRESSP